MLSRSGKNAARHTRFIAPCHALGSLARDDPPDIRQSAHWWCLAGEAVLRRLYKAHIVGRT